jgi:thiazole synthase ThiGH ThiG subunit
LATTDVSADPLTIAGTELRSRLLLGTGGFRSLETLAASRRATRC